MLAGLSNSFPSSHHCFNLLKANSPSLGGGGPSAAISLDHFYDSLHNYYVSLRQTPGARQPPSSSISPQELDGLTAVLKLIQTIANLVSVYINQMLKHCKMQSLYFITLITLLSSVYIY